MGRLKVKRIKAQRTDILGIEKLLDKKDFQKLVETAKAFGKDQLLIYIEKKKIKKGIIFCTRTGKEKDRSNIWREMKKIASCQESVWKRYSRTTCGIFSQEHSTERRKTLFI